MSARITIDLNVRIGRDGTYAGFEDVDGEIALEDVVEVIEPETRLWGAGRVTAIDHARKLVFLSVDWSALRSESRRSQVIEGSGEPVKGRRLGHMLSIRLKPEQFDVLCEAAAACGMTLSAFVRRVALASAKRRSRPQPPTHTCNLIGCQWCDPDGEFEVVVVSTIAGATSEGDDRG